MESLLKTFSIGFLLRSVFSGVFFVIAYYVASHTSAELSKLDCSNELSVVLSGALFAGVTAYGIHRSLFYPGIEYFFDSPCGKAWRQTAPLISSSTIDTILWRWDQASDHTTFDREQINEKLNVWGDFIQMQYVSTICIALGALAGTIVSTGRHPVDYPLIILAVLLFLAAFISNWRHHSLIDYIRTKSNEA